MRRTFSFGPFGPLVILAFLAGAARADKDPQEVMADQQAKAAAPDSGRVGAFFHGAGKKTDFVTILEVGKCYYWSGAGGAGVKKLYVYLWGPDGKRITENRAPTALAGMAHCPTVPGAYKFQGKIDGDGPYVIGLYAKGAPQQALAERAPPPPPPVAAAPPPPPQCFDGGETGSADASFTCEDGKAIDIYFDGQFIKHAPGEMPIHVRNVGAGCHRVKVDCWTGVFKHGVQYDGPVKLFGQHENRYHSRPGALDLVGKTPLAPPPPPVMVAQGPGRDQIRDAMEFLRDAVEYNNAAYSPCQPRIAGKLEALRDYLKDFARGENDIGRVFNKVDDVHNAVRDFCPPEVAQAIGRKLQRIDRALGR